MRNISPRLAGLLVTLPCLLMLNACMGGLGASSPFDLDFTLVDLIPANPVMQVNQNLQLTVEVNHNGKITNDSPATYNWTSSNSSVASVDGNGLVRGIAGGSAKVSILSRKDGKEVAHTQITVAGNSSISVEAGTAAGILVRFPSPAVGDRGYVVDPSAPVLHVFDGQRYELQSVKLETAHPARVSIAPTGMRLYALDGESGALETFDIELGTGLVTRRVGVFPTCARPLTLAADPISDAVQITCPDRGTLTFAAAAAQHSQEVIF